MRKLHFFSLLLCLLTFISARSQNPAFVTDLNELIRMYSSGQMSKACEYAAQILTTYNTNKEKADTAYPYVLYYTAIVNGLQRNYSVCRPIVDELEELTLKRFGKNDIKYWSALVFQCKLQEDLPSRIKYQEKCRSILKNIYYDPSITVVRTFDLTYKKEDIKFFLEAIYSSLAMSYTHTNRHAEGVASFKESEKYYDEEYTLRTDPQSYIVGKSNYGSYLLLIEELEMAENVYAELESWVLRNFNETHPIYGEALYRMGNFYYSLGDYIKSERHLLKAKKIFENTFQKDNVNYYYTLFRLCDIYFSGTDSANIELLAKDLKKTSQRIDSVQKAARVFSWLFLIDYYQIKKLEHETDSVLKILDIFFEGKNFSSTYTYNSYLATKAYLYTKKKQYQEADLVYSMQLDYRKNTGVADSKAYSNLLLKKSINLFKWGKQEEAIEELKKSIQTISKTLEKNFRFMSENEKLVYTQTTANFFNELNILALTTHKSELSELAYDCQLILKNLLLKTSVLANRTNIRSDPEYAGLVTDYLDVRKKIVFQASLPSEEKFQYEKLVEEAEKMEKKIARVSGAFIKDQFRALQARDLIKYLKPDEAAIEFTHYNTPDSVFYIALLLTKHSPTPLTIPLFNKSKLDEILNRTKSANNEKAINSLYNNAELYNLVWAPIEKNLTGISSIYFSSSGELYKMPITILSNNNEQRVCDKYKFIQLNSTALLIETSKDHLDKSDKLYLYGGMFYDGDSMALKQAVAKFNTNSFASRGISILGERSGRWDYLPETKTEVEAIDQLAKNSNIASTLLTGWDATEESVKILKGQNSPAIIHLATHGFFYSDPAKRQSKYNILEAKAFTNAENPLMRSGLLFTGANYAWDNKPIKGIQDGVLTAYEIADLNLANTKLAVLSACETGLGDIVGYEGVYGLQRAFKIAGVKNLVMSLWTVPDKVTAEFMIEFYKDMISGISIDGSFNSARAKIRHRYPNEPYKWGAWILVK